MPPTILTNGNGTSQMATALRVRGAYPSDESAVLGLLDRLGAPRIRSRYEAPDLAPPQPDRPGPTLARGVVAVADVGGGDRLVGFAAWHPTADLDVAEAVLAVDDGWRLAGVAERLLSVLADRAARAGVRTFTVEIVPHNAVLRAASRALGFVERREGVRVAIELPGPVAAG